MLILLLAAIPALAGASVVVSSDPDGLPLLLDGADTGRTTPARLDDLPPGPHTLAVRRGCLAGEATVDLADGEVARVGIPARERPATVRLDISPWDAIIEIDGTRLRPGTTSWQVPCGAHTLHVNRDGYVPQLVTFEITAPDATVPLRVELEEVGAGFVQLDIAVPGAVVLVDGQRRRTDRRGRLKLTAGPHLVEVRADGHAPARLPVVVEEDATVRLAVPLTPLPAGEPRSAAAEPAPAPAEPPAAEPREPAPARPVPAEPAAPTAARGGSAGRAIGLGLVGVGVGLGVVAGLQYAATLDAYRTYQDRVAAVESDPSLGAAYANTWFDEEVRPARERLWAAGAGAVAFLATGLVVRGSF